MNKLPRHFYSLLLYLAAVPLMLYFLLRSRKDGRYRRRLPERFGLGHAQSQPGGLVVHAVSVGEVVAATPLIKQLQQTYVDLPITITCTTPTGLATIEQRFGNKLAYGYLPFDYPGSVRRFINHLQPRAVIILETELWPNLMAYCDRAQIPVIVANARLSAQSARGYRRFYCFTTTLMRHILLLLVQDRDSARRFACLRLSQFIEITGNLKFDMDIPEDISSLVEQFAPKLKGRLVWVAGSTHEGEDEMLLNTYRALQADFPSLLLILVPRHPERFERVADLIRRQNFICWRRSEGGFPEANTQIALADSMGELLAWYQLANLVFVGGSLVNHGGHNPLEAACFAKCIQSGPYHFNFAEAYSQLQRCGAVSMVADEAELTENTRALLTNGQLRHQFGERAQVFFQKQQGVTQRTLSAIERILGPDVGQFRCQREAGQIFWYQGPYFQQMSSDIFSSDWYRQQGAVRGSASGRNTVWFVQHEGRSMVLRHYYRGGLIGKILGDRFLACPVLSSRAMLEFSLLQWMYQQGLPVPRPCAARYYRRGLFYRADILVELIPQSRDLVTVLSEPRALSTSEWQQVGLAIARMHAKGVYHADLNCHNILLDANGKVWLVDFDKCERRRPGAWQQQNLQRLLRSLRKERNKLPVFTWQESDWQALMVGYESHRESPEGVLL
ncbi:MAG TPA: lipid IV(A) 3-deoxy-D-manno-octulosonic acid transferase [Cellvibrionaceae bacterium]